MTAVTRWQRPAFQPCAAARARVASGAFFLVEDLVFMCRVTCSTRNCWLQMRRKCSSEKKIVIKMLFMCA